MGRLRWAAGPQADTGIFLEPKKNRVCHYWETMLEVGVCWQRKLPFCGPLAVHFLGLCHFCYGEEYQWCRQKHPAGVRRGFNMCASARLFPQTTQLIWGGSHRRWTFSDKKAAGCSEECRLLSEMRVQSGAGYKMKCCRDYLETSLEYCIESIPKTLHSCRILCLYDLKQP